MPTFNEFIQEKTINLAIKIVNAYTLINQKLHFASAAVVLSKQFLRSGTSIGAMCREAQSAQSKKDYINKLEIALKEARETEYWIQLLIETNSVPQQKFSAILNDLDEVIRILVSTIKSTKEKI
jgi:four helix bundle protein